MNDFGKPAEAITEIDGIKVAGVKPGFVYYTFRFEGSKYTQGEVFSGFGDPTRYGYDFGAALYTNLTEEYRLPETRARWWALSEIKISIPNAKVEDLVSLLMGLVLRLSIVTRDEVEVDLFTVPLFSLVSTEGIGLERHNYRGGVNTFTREMLQTTPIPVAYPIRCELVIGKDLEVESEINILLYANVIYFFALPDKRVAAAVEPEAMAGPTGIRFATDVVKKINRLVDSGTVSSKSEFVREAVDAALDRIGG